MRRKLTALISKLSTARPLDTSHDAAWVREWLIAYDTNKALGRL